MSHPPFPARLPSQQLPPETPRARGLLTVLIVLIALTLLVGIATLAATIVLSRGGLAPAPVAAATETRALTSATLTPLAAIAEGTREPTAEPTLTPTPTPIPTNTPQPSPTPMPTPSVMLAFDPAYGQALVGNLAPLPLAIKANNQTGGPVYVALRLIPAERPTDPNAPSPPVGALVALEQGADCPIQDLNSSNRQPDVLFQTVQPGVPQLFYYCPPQALPQSGLQQETRSIRIRADQVFIGPSGETPAQAEMGLMLRMDADLQIRFDSPNSTCSVNNPASPPATGRATASLEGIPVMVRLTGGTADTSQSQAKYALTIILDAQDGKFYENGKPLDGSKITIIRKAAVGVFDAVPGLCFVPASSSDATGLPSVAVSVIGKFAETKIYPLWRPTNSIPLRDQPDLTRQSVSMPANNVAQIIGRLPDGGWYQVVWDRVARWTQRSSITPNAVIGGGKMLDLLPTLSPTPTPGAGEQPGN